MQPSFRVEVVAIGRVEPHPNADRLEIATPAGTEYRVIVGKGEYQPGDLAFYFPLDSVIPDEAVKELGIGQYYNGKKLKAAKLRGVFSEGLLHRIPPQDVASKLQRLFSRLTFGLYSGGWEVGDDATLYWGVTKWEEPVTPQLGRGAKRENAIPDMLHFPAPSHLKKYPKVIGDDDDVAVTEKLHGSNCMLYKDAEGGLHYGSHNFFWADTPENAGLAYIRAFKQIPHVIEALPRNCQLFGEVIGVQDMKYGLRNGEVAFVAFAIKRDGKFLPYMEFVDMCDSMLHVSRVPLVYLGAYGDIKSHLPRIIEFDSFYAGQPGHVMEGVVITRTDERTDARLGRVALKLVSERYLLRKGATEAK